MVVDEWLCSGEMTGLGWRCWRSWAIENRRLGHLRRMAMGQSKQWRGRCKDQVEAHLHVSLTRFDQRLREHEGELRGWVERSVAKGLKGAENGNKL